MEKIRCNWVSNDELYIKYHDEEWGKPIYDDKVLSNINAGFLDCMDNSKNQLLTHIDTIE